MAWYLIYIEHSEDATKNIKIHELCKFARYKINVKNVAFLYTNNELLKNLIKQSHLQLHQKVERCIFWKLQDTNEIKIIQISGNYSNGLDELILLKCPSHQKAIYSFITVLIKISIALSTKQLFWNLYGSTHQKKKKERKKRKQK